MIAREGFDTYRIDLSEEDRFVPKDAGRRSPPRCPFCRKQLCLQIYARENMKALLDLNFDVPYLEEMGRTYGHEKEYFAFVLIEGVKEALNFGQKLSYKNK